MGARAGQNNFRRHQRDVVNAGVKRLKLALQAMPRRMRFDDFYALAHYVAKAVGMHPTTVGRNPRYRQTILEHIESNPAIIAQDRTRTPVNLRSDAAKAASWINATLLKRDNERLRKMVAAISAHQHPTSTSTLPADVLAEVEHLRRSFQCTATVLARLLNWAAEKEIGIIVDIDRGEILDAAEIGRNQVIAARPDTTAFFNWLKHHINQDEGSSRA